MNSKDIELRAKLLEERTASLKVQKLGSTFIFWIPRSQVSYMRKQKLNETDTEIVFKLPEWLVEKEQLWDLET